MAANPFDTIESAYQYVSLLKEQVEAVRLDIACDCDSAAVAGRRLDALRLVDYKLNQLARHLSASGLVLNDLRMLRRLLLEERDAAGESRFEVAVQPE